MRVRLALAALVNSVFINGQANMAAVTRLINLGILFTNHKLSSIYSVSVPRSRSKSIAIMRNYAEKLIFQRYFGEGKYPIFGQCRSNIRPQSDLESRLSAQ